MAQWSKKYTPPANLNGGNEYTEDSDVTLDTFNVANNNAFYAVEQSKMATDTANEALEHAQKNGTQTFVNNQFQSRLDFTTDPQEQIDKLNGIYLGKGATLLDMTRYNDNKNKEFRYYGYQAVDGPNSGLYSMYAFYYGGNWVGLMYFDLNITENIWLNSYNGTKKAWTGWKKLVTSSGG